MIRAIYISAAGESGTEFQIDNIPAVLESKPRLIWIDITIGNNEFSNEEIALLTETFKFHELSIEDSLFPQYHPKIEEFEQYVFVALHGIRLKAKDLSDIENAIYELDLFVGKDFVVTVHTGELGVIDNLFEKAKLKTHIELRTIENLLYNIFQKVVSSFEFTLEVLGDRFDALETKLLENPSATLVTEIFELKKILLNLRKVTEPQQNVYTYFTRETNGMFSRKSAAYFRDIFFQFDRINQSIASQNQIVSSILEIYVSGATLKLNEVMKVLTIIATILLPVVVIASYYGMNVRFPEHRIFGEDNVWYFAMGLIVASTLAALIFFRRKKWL